MMVIEILEEIPQAGEREELELGGFVESCQAFIVDLTVDGEDPGALLVSMVSAPAAIASAHRAHFQ